MCAWWFFSKKASCCELVIPTTFVSQFLSQLRCYQLCMINNHFHMIPLFIVDHIRLVARVVRQICVYRLSHYELEKLYGRNFCTITFATILMLMMLENQQWATRSTRARNDTCTAQKGNLTKSTGVVSAKYPPKVKLEFLTTLER